MRWEQPLPPAHDVPRWPRSRREIAPQGLSWARSHDISTVLDRQKITLSAANGWTYSSPDIFEGSTVTLSEVDAWPETVTQSATLTGPDGEPIEANGDGSYMFTAPMPTVRSATF